MRDENRKLKVLIHKGFDDLPKLAAEAKAEEEGLAHYRRVRDEIRGFVDSFPEFLSVN